jgi:UDP-sulfoquinovose synthase
MKFLVVLSTLTVAATAFIIPTPKAPVRAATALFAAANGGSATPKKIIVLGGDGFCGWPTSLYLSDQGHDVVVVDNLSRRNIDIELGCDSLTPIRSMEVSLCFALLYGCLVVYCCRC